MLAKFLVFLTLIYPHVCNVCSASDNYISDNSDDCGPSVKKYLKYLVSIADMTPVNKKVARQFGKGHECTGIIASPRLIVTTRNCVERCRLANLAAIAGAPELTKQEKTTQIITKGIEYGLANMGLGYLKLKDDLNLDGVTAEHLDYTPQKIIKPGQKCILVGWGRSGNKCEFKMQYKNMVILEEKVCDEGMFPSAGIFCARNLNPVDSNGCLFDVGRPLLCNDKFVGIELFNRKCSSVNETTYFIDIVKLASHIVSASMEASERSSGQKVLANNMFLKFLGVNLFLIVYLKIK